MNSSLNERAKAPLGFRIIVWTLALIVLANVGAAVAPVIVEPVMYVFRLCLDKILELEVSWRRLQPQTRGLILLAFLLFLFAWISRSLRKQKEGDGSEELR
jgi:hypothetical protein